jgi:hypothetical protein
MSTRNSIVLASEGTTLLHLYHERHDSEAVHLEIALDGTNVRLNLVVPAVLVPGVTAVLKRAEAPAVTSESRRSPASRQG